MPEMKTIFIVLTVIFGFGVEGARIRAIRRRWIQYPAPTPNVVSTQTRSYSWQSPVYRDGKVIYSYTNPGGIRLNLIGRKSIATAGAHSANLNQYATNERQAYPTQYSHWYPYQVPLNNGGNSGYLYERWQNGGGPIDISINNGRRQQKKYAEGDDDNVDLSLNLSLKDGEHSERIGDSAQSSHSENGELDPLIKYGIVDEDRDAQIASDNQRIILVEPHKENRDAGVIVQDVNDDSINNEDGRSVIGERENGQIISDTDGFSDNAIDIDNEENIVSQKDTISTDDQIANSESPTERNEVEDQPDQVFVDNSSQDRVPFDIVPDGIGKIVHNQQPETLPPMPSPYPAPMPAMPQYNGMPQMPQYNPAWSPVSPIRPPPHVFPYNAYNVPPNQIREPASGNFRPLVHPVVPNVCPSRTTRARSLLETIQEFGILPPRHNFQNVERPYISPQNNIWNNKRPYYYNGVQDPTYRDRTYWDYYNNRDRFGVPFHTIPNVALELNQFNPAQIRIANDDPSSETPKVEESPILVINPDTGKEELIAVNHRNDSPQPESINIVEQLRAGSQSNEDDLSFEQMQDILNLITSDIAMFVHSPCYHGDSTSLVKGLKTVIHSMNQQQCIA